MITMSKYKSFRKIATPEAWDWLYDDAWAITCRLKTIQQFFDLSEPTHDWFVEMRKAKMCPDGKAPKYLPGLNREMIDFLSDMNLDIDLHESELLRFAEENQSSRDSVVSELWKKIEELWDEVDSEQELGVDELVTRLRFFYDY